MTRRLEHIVRTAMLSAAVLILIATGADGQSLSVSASVNETTIGTEERLTYTIEVQGPTLPNIQAPELPSFTGLTLNSRFPSTSRNISIVNGQMTQSIGFNWSFTPVQEGSASVGAASVEIDGENFTTEPIRIRVVPQSQRPARRPSRNPLLDPFGMLDTPPDDAPAPEISSTDVFIEARPNKRRVYQNEPVTIEYGLYFRSGIQLRQSRLADSWDAEGFWREDLDVEARPVPRTIVRSGIRYNMIVLKRVVVFPTRTGELTVDPLKIESEASVPLSGRETFFSMRNRYVPVELSSPAVRLNVRPLPRGAPDSFTGAVGSFEFDAFVDKDALEVGESLTLKATVSGSGNLATLEPPQTDLPGIFEQYDPHVDTRLNRSGSTVTGSKTFEYVLIPRSNGTFEIPGVEFSFFDPAAGRYRTERSEAVSVSVTGTSIPMESVAIAAGSGFPIDDVAPIVVADSDWKRISGADALHRSAIPYAVIILPLLGLVGVYFVKKHADKIIGDVEYARNRRANPLARKHLKVAAERLARRDDKGYYEELEKAVTGYVGNRLNVGENALTRDELTALLVEQGARSATMDDLRDLLSECDMARFSPVRPERSVMDQALERASRIITDLEEAFTESKEEVPA